MRKTRSYPERLVIIRNIEHNLLSREYQATQEALHAFKQKDLESAERLAQLGSPTSTSLIPNRGWRGRCFDYILRWLDYMLERGEEERKTNEQILTKSYAGFYYFLKWFIRSVFLTAFTVIGNILGKELGCAIKTHDVCDDNAFLLWDRSPHVIASLSGSISGLVIGQWVGRLFWDKSVETIQSCLRRCEKIADRSKCVLLMICIIVYLLGTITFGIIFWRFIKIESREISLLIGSSIGSIIGLIFAGYSYNRTSPCISNQETPQLRPDVDYSINSINSINDLPPI